MKKVLAALAALALLPALAPALDPTPREVAVGWREQADLANSRQIADKEFADFLYAFYVAHLFEASPEEQERMLAAMEAASAEIALGESWVNEGGDPEYQAGLGKLQQGDDAAATANFAIADSYYDQAAGRFQAAQADYMQADRHFVYAIEYLLPSTGEGSGG